MALGLTPNEVARAEQDRAARARLGVSTGLAAPKIEKLPRAKKIKLLPPAIARELIAPLPQLRPGHIVKLSGVYVARKDSFEVEFRHEWSAARALDLLFEILPLAEHGWKRESTQILHLNGRSWRVWRT